MRRLVPNLRVAGWRPDRDPSLQHPPGSLRAVERTRSGCDNPPSSAAHHQGATAMPIVRVEMFPGRTHAQKQELARAITEAVANIAHTTPDATIVIFTDIAREDWAQAG